MKGLHNRQYVIEQLGERASYSLDEIVCLFDRRMLTLERMAAKERSIATRRQDHVRRLVGEIPSEPDISDPEAYPWGTLADAIHWRQKLVKELGVALVRALDQDDRGKRMASMGAFADRLSEYVELSDWIATERGRVRVAA